MRVSDYVNKANAPGASQLYRMRSTIYSSRSKVASDSVAALIQLSGGGTEPTKTNNAAGARELAASAGKSIWRSEDIRVAAQQLFAMKSSAPRGDTRISEAFLVNPLELSRAGCAGM